MAHQFTRVEFSNLDKILYPELRITKKQVIEYYIRTAPRMLQILGDRPAVLTRFPNGIHEEGFYEKDAPLGKPTWVETFRNFSETAKRNIDYVLCNNLDTLVWLANLAALEIHITLSKAKQYKTPDLILFDLDPQPPGAMDDAVNVALLLKEKLGERGYESFVKTSGKKGLHVVIPIREEYTFQKTRNFVHEIGKELAGDSEKVISEAHVKKPGAILIDYAQNSHGKTMICPYSLRAVPKATVSMPLEWNQVKKGLDPEDFSIANVTRVEKEPWTELLTKKQKREEK
jgi:bifunctional non-homologous end joining protein LigD